MRIAEKMSKQYTMFQDRIKELCDPKPKRLLSFFSSLTTSKKTKKNKTKIKTVPPPPSNMNSHRPAGQLNIPSNNSRPSQQISPTVQSSSTNIITPPSASTGNVRSGQSSSMIAQSSSSSAQNANNGNSISAIADNAWFARMSSMLSQERTPGGPSPPPQKMNIQQQPSPQARFYSVSSIPLIPFFFFFSIFLFFFFFFFNLTWLSFFLSQSFLTFSCRDPFFLASCSTKMLCSTLNFFSSQSLPLFAFLPSKDFIFYFCLVLLLVFF